MCVLRRSIWEDSLCAACTHNRSQLQRGQQESHPFIHRLIDLLLLLPLPLHRRSVGESKRERDTRAHLQEAGCRSSEREREEREQSHKRERGRQMTLKHPEMDASYYTQGSKDLATETPVTVNRLETVSLKQVAEGGCKTALTRRSSECCFNGRQRELCMSRLPDSLARISP
jgi:hypothetical protein